MSKWGTTKPPATHEGYEARRGRPDIQNVWRLVQHRHQPIRGRPEQEQVWVSTVTLPRPEVATHPSHHLSLQVAQRRLRPVFEPQKHIFPWLPQAVATDCYTHKPKSYGPLFLCKWASPCLQGAHFPFPLEAALPHFADHSLEQSLLLPHPRWRTPVGIGLWPWPSVNKFNSSFIFVFWKTLKGKQFTAHNPTAEKINPQSFAL